MFDRRRFLQACVVGVIASRETYACSGIPGRPNFQVMPPEQPPRSQSLAQFLDQHLGGTPWEWDNRKIIHMRLPQEIESNRRVPLTIRMPVLPGQRCASLDIIVERDFGLQIRTRYWKWIFPESAHVSEVGARLDFFDSPARVITVTEFFDKNRQGSKHVLVAASKRFREYCTDDRILVKTYEEALQRCKNVADPTYWSKDIPQHELDTWAESCIDDIRFY